MPQKDTDAAGVTRKWDPDEPVASRASGRRLRIPRDRSPGWPSRIGWTARSSPHAEAFRHLALRVGSELAAREASSVLVTSALPQEGKTLTACNLALAFASLASTERVALVDFDLRAPGVARVFGLEPLLGIAEVLRGDAPLEAAAILTDAHLDIYPVARAFPAAHQLLARRECADLLKQLEANYRFVVCDSPPCLPVPDVGLLTPYVGGCLAVVRAGKTPRSVVRELVERLDRGKFMGFFFNDARPPRHARHHYRSHFESRDAASEGESS
jgi:Mrp family chromosome partitioning ATPase